MFGWAARLFLVHCLAAPAAAFAQEPEPGPWTAAFTTINPLPVGACAAVHLTVVDPASGDVPRNSLGKRVTVAAQVTAKPAKGGMVDEKVSIGMPFILRDFSPAFDGVKAVCRVFQSDGLEVSSKESVPQKTTPRDADGLAGTLVTLHEFKRSATETGMVGHYRCALEAVTLSGSGEAFSVAPNDVAFGMSAGKNEVIGSITW